MIFQVIEFTGTFVPVSWTCRAPLASGKLCPRQDRYKCPFHGKIVGRDKMGQPSNVEDKMRLEEEEERKRNENPSWQDPELLKVRFLEGMNYWNDFKFFFRTSKPRRGSTFKSERKKIPRVGKPVGRGNIQDSLISKKRRIPWEKGWRRKCSIKGRLNESLGPSIE